MKFQLLVCILFLPLLNSCSSLFRSHCNTVDAYRMGEEDAGGWNSSKPQLARGSACTEEYSVGQFQNDYMNGFTNRLRMNCTESNAFEAGASDGQSENTSKSSILKFKACEEIRVKYTQLTSSYEKGFTQAFCTTEKAQAKGAARAQAWERPDNSYISTFCKGQKSNLMSSYQNAYEDALANTCTEIAITEKASKDADARLNKFDQLRKMEICPKTSGLSLVQLYTSTYDRRALELQLEQERAQRAKEVQELNRKLDEQRQVLENQNRISGTSGGQTDFYYDGYRLYAYCNIRSAGTADLTIRNPNSRTVSVHGTFVVEYFDQYKRILSRRELRESQTVWSNGEAKFSDNWAPTDARYCKVFFR